MHTVTLIASGHDVRIAGPSIVGITIAAGLPAPAGELSSGSSALRRDGHAAPAVPHKVAAAGHTVSLNCGHHVVTGGHFVAYTGHAVSCGGQTVDAE